MILYQGDSLAAKSLEDKQKNTKLNIKTLFRPRAVKGVASHQPSPKHAIHAARGSPRVNMRMTQMLPSNDFVLM